MLLLCSKSYKCLLSPTHTLCLTLGQACSYLRTHVSLLFLCLDFSPGQCIEQSLVFCKPLIKCHFSQPFHVKLEPCTLQMLPLSHFLFTFFHLFFNIYYYHPYIHMFILFTSYLSCRNINARRVRVFWFFFFFFTVIFSASITSAT